MAATPLRSSAAAAPGDTTRILVGHRSLPNSTAADSVDANGVPWLRPDAWYDAITEADDGSAVRWGCVRLAAPATPSFNPNGGYASRTVEDNNARPGYVVLLAFNLRDLSPGDRVLSAHVMVNEQRLGDGFDLSTGYVAARLDTVAADYAMIASGSGDVVDGTDACYLNTSYDMVDVDAGIPWRPPLARRDDLHDFGPSSHRFAPGRVIENMGCIRLDVTDAVQQLLDRGHPFDGWALFLLNVIGTPDGIATFMFGDDAVRVPGGNPVFTAVVTHERGPHAWGDVHVPVVLSVDDGLEIHARYRDILAGAGKPYSEVAPYSAFNSIGGALLGPAQRDSINETPGVDLVLHTRDHPGLGTLTDDHALDYQLARDWTLEVFTNPRDTTTLVDFAWAGAGADTANYSLQALSRIVANGYRSARTATANWSRGIGRMTPLALDRYVNLYAVPAMNWTALFGTEGSPFTVTAMRDTLMDYLDRAWTDHGRAPLMIYGHRGDAGENGTYTMVSELVNRIDEIPDVDFMSIGDVVSTRLDGQIQVAPCFVMSAADARPSDRAAAALYDSVLATDGDLHMLKVWLPPVDTVLPPDVSSTPVEAMDTASLVRLTGSPNPFNPTVEIRYVLTAPGEAIVRIHDVRGRLVMEVDHGWRGIGEHVARWSGRDGRGASVAAGVYLCEVTCVNSRGVLKISLVK